MTGEIETFHNAQSFPSLRADEQARLRAELVTACAAYRNADDMSAERMADAYLSEGRALVDGNAFVFLADVLPGERDALRTHTGAAFRDNDALNAAWTTTRRAAFPLDEGVSVHLGQLDELRRRHAVIAAEAAARRAAQEKADATAAIFASVRGELRSRATKWLGLDPLARALLRLAPDARPTAHELAAAILAEPAHTQKMKRNTDDEPGTQPPAHAFAVLGVKPHKHIEGA